MLEDVPDGGDPRLDWGSAVSTPLGQPTPSRPHMGRICFSARRTIWSRKCGLAEVGIAVLLFCGTY